MSVYANTLNAYAAKLKAQRKAAEREAELLARSKSAEQRNADKMRIEQAKAEKIVAESKQKYSATNISNICLDKITRTFREDFNVGFASGERVKVANDLKKICELFYYEGEGRMYLKVDASRYTKTAFNIMVSVLVNMKVMTREQASEGARKNLRQIVVLRENEKASVALSPINTSIESIKEIIAENEHLRKEYAV